MRISLQNRIQKITGYVTQGMGIVAFFSLFLNYGFHLSPAWLVRFVVMDEFIALLFVVILLTNFIISDKKWNFIKQSPFELILMILFIVSIITEEIISIEEPHYLLKRSTSHNFIKLYFIIIQIYIAINGIIALAKTREKWLYRSLSPARIVVFSYLIVIFLGTLILKLPKATYEDIKWIDAFFTSASAVCITGLTTLNISKVFTLEGQVFILILIQLGGLGIITLTSFVALFVQRGLRLRDQLIVQELFDSENFSSLTSIVKAIIAITFLSELAGATGLYFLWKDLNMSDFERLFASAFHSISAYCNAGFSIFPAGFESAGLKFNNLSMILVMALIVAGGIGFYTYSDIFRIGSGKKNGRLHLLLQTRIILVSTLILILLGATLIWVLQSRQWTDMSLGQQILNSFFLSVTARTAGFSTVSVAGLAVPALMIMLFLMYIGGAPNSSSGGIKITTMVTVFASIRAYITGKNKVEIGWNNIPVRTIRRALIVVLMSFVLVFIALFILSVTEDQDFLNLLFETISAFGNVGLSRGITPDLSNTGKIIISMVMFAGRIGLFTFAVAMTEEREDNGYNFPESNIMVG